MRQVEIRNWAEDVFALHRFFGHPTDGAMTDMGLQSFRLDLIDEERNEVRDGFRRQSREEVLDGCIDLIVVTLGTAVAAGFTPEQIQAAWNEVQRANATKVRNGPGKWTKPADWRPPDYTEILG